MSSKTIYVSDGFAEYVGGVLTESTGADISIDTFEVSLGSYDAPPASGWQAPDVNEYLTASSRRVQKLVDSSDPLGTWWLWFRITDNPEVIPIRLNLAIVIE